MPPASCHEGPCFKMKSRHLGSEKKWFQHPVVVHFNKCLILGWLFWEKHAGRSKNPEMIVKPHWHAHLLLWSCLFWHFLTSGLTRFSSFLPFSICTLRSRGVGLQADLKKKSNKSKYFTHSGFIHAARTVVLRDLWTCLNHTLQQDGT